MYEELLGIRQPVDSYGFERLELAPPLIASLPAMAGKVRTVRGEVVLSWAWRGEPMHGSNSTSNLPLCVISRAFLTERLLASAAFTLNCSIPPNVRTTVAIPVPGLTKPVVTESGSVVWKGDVFASGVAGVTAGAAANDSTILLSVGSGSYSFVTSASAADERSEPDPVVLHGCDTRLECPTGSTIARIVRAGLSPSDSGSSGLRSRFLLAHVLEQQCGGRSACDLDSARAARSVAPAVALRLAGGSRLCADVVCQ